MSEEEQPPTTNSHYTECTISATNTFMTLQVKTFPWRAAPTDTSLSPPFTNKWPPNTGLSWGPQSTTSTTQAFNSSRRHGTQRTVGHPHAAVRETLGRRCYQALRQREPTEGCHALQPLLTHRSTPVNAITTTDCQITLCLQWDSQSYSLQQCKAQKFPSADSHPLSPLTVTPHRHPSPSPLTITPHHTAHHLPSLPHNNKCVNRFINPPSIL